MASKILFKRGAKNNLPILAEGEPGFATDTKEMFIGTGTANIPVGSVAGAALLAEDNMFRGLNTFGAWGKPVVFDEVGHSFTKGTPTVPVVWDTVTIADVTFTEGWSGSDLSYTCNPLSIRECLAFAFTDPINSGEYVEVVFTVDSPTAIGRFELGMCESGIDFERNSLNFWNERMIDLPCDLFLAGAKTFTLYIHLTGERNSIGNVPYICLGVQTSLNFKGSFTLVSVKKVTNVPNVALTVSNIPFTLNKTDPRYMADICIGGGNRIRTTATRFNQYGNVSLGDDAGLANNATNNIFIGSKSGYSVRTAGGGVYIGARANSTGSGGDNCVILGGEAAPFNSAAQNTVIGASSMLYNIKGAANTVVGYQAGNSIRDFNNTTSIGANASCTAANQITLGNSAITALRCQVTTITSLSDTRIKEDMIPADLDLCLEAVKNLPVTRYKYKDFTGTHIDKHVTGWLADDVEKVFPKSVTTCDEYFTEVDENGDIVYETVTTTDTEGNEVTTQVEKRFKMESVKNITMTEALPTLWGAMQKMVENVEALTQRVDYLERKCSEAGIIV